MATRIYKHLFLETIPYSIPFTPQTGGRKPVRPERLKDRAGHSKAILASVRSIVAKQKGAIEKIETFEPGYHLTAHSRSKTGIDASSFKGAGAVAKILSIQGDETKQRANLFVRQDQLEAFTNRLSSYSAHDEGSAKRAPASFWFFESTSRISGTTLKDLWTDPEERFPQTKGINEWEIWVRPDAASALRSFSQRFGVQFELGELEFPGATMMRVRATEARLEQLVIASGAVLELRACSSLTLETLDLGPVQRRQLLTKLRSKITAPDEDAPRICVLDTGVDALHPLLQPALPTTRCHTLNDSWSANGWDPHGTRIAGIALFTNLEHVIASRDPVALTTTLESVTVLRPPAAPRAAIEAFGVIPAAVDLVEKEPARRVFCLAFADYNGPNDGTQTVLSASVDQLAWGRNGQQRLFCVAAGNLLDDPLRPSGYPERNELSGIASPGQALNALTVGGCTFVSEHPDDGELLAPEGDISPTSRTSRSWRTKATIKPDVVFEAGNHGLSSDGRETEALPELGVLTTSTRAQGGYATLMETSAATAAVAGMAGRLTAEYPDYWPETIRGLIVHSTSWTDAMRARFEHLPHAEAVEAMLQMYGWGVPDERVARRSASDLLTFVIQDELAPFTIKEGDIRTNNLSYYELPWPSTVLQQLGGAEVELRVTLSYFVDPNLRAASLHQYSRYHSHRFGFDLKGPDDDHVDAVRRGNKALKTVRAGGVPKRTEAGWDLGSLLRQRGTIHHDRWRGEARDLAKQDGISILPRGGWWYDDASGNYTDVKARYSLVISIHTPSGAQDIYQATRSRIAPLARTRNPALVKIEAQDTRTPIAPRKK